MNRGEMSATGTDKVAAVMKLMLKLGRQKIKQKITPNKVHFVIYDKTIKDDTMESNLILRQSLDSKPVWGEQVVRGRMIAFSS